MVLNENIIQHKADNSIFSKKARRLIGVYSLCISAIVSPGVNSSINNVISLSDNNNIHDSIKLNIDRHKENILLRLKPFLDKGHNKTVITLSSEGKKGLASIMDDIIMVTLFDGGENFMYSYKMSDNESYEKSYIVFKTKINKNTEIGYSLESIEIVDRQYKNIDLTH